MIFVFLPRGANDSENYFTQQGEGLWDRGRGRGEGQGGVAGKGGCWRWYKKPHIRQVN